MASYRKRGERWYAEVRKRGHYESGTFRTKQQARQWADRVEDDIDAGKPRGAHTLLEALRKYATEVSPTKRGVRWERVRLRALESLLPFVSRPLESITPPEIASWRDTRVTQVKSSSCRREMILLTSVFEQARREWQWIATNPMRDVRKPGSGQPRNQTVPDHLARQLFEVAGYQRGVSPLTRQQLVCAAFDFALETAMRAGEIRALRAAQMYVVQRYVHVGMSKTGATRDVPLSSGAVEILESLDDSEPFPLTAQQLDANFRKIKRKAGLSDAFTFHDSRAEATTRLAKKLPLEDLARATGHTDWSSLRTYYREHASDIAKRLR